MLILADEPTGNLDSETSYEVMALVQRLNRDQGITVVLVTHEHDIAELRVARGDLSRRQAAIDLRDARGAGAAVDRRRRDLAMKLLGMTSSAPRCARCGSTSCAPR